MTDHMWVGYWMVVNGTFWNSMPESHRKTVANAFDAQALEERVTNQNLNNTLEATLTQQGLTFTRPDHGAFQAAPAKSGIYKTWETQFGPTLWSALEKFTGPLG